MRRDSRPEWCRAGWAATLVMSAVLAGCATGSGGRLGALSAPADAPAQFLVLDGNGSRPVRPDDGCRNPMVDPRDGARLRLVRSANGQGDYKVPLGRYGVGHDQLLRLDCATGGVVGIVPEGR